ncbi:hypothetical protein NGM37_24665, partial [Streptomyces sp. TRM76130]|nr:hypothetical protein [Streptomyces sp. TRM76130]
SVLDERYAGSSFDAAAGPPFKVPGGPSGGGGPEPAVRGAASGAGPAPSQGEVSATLDRAQRDLLAWVERNNGSAVYTFATDHWEAAAPYILDEALPVLPLGGFTGGANSVTLAGFRALVADGSLRFALLRDADGENGGAPGGARQPDTSVARISDWVRSACVEVDPAEYGAGAKATAGGGEGGSGEGAEQRQGRGQGQKGTQGLEAARGQGREKAQGEARQAERLYRCGSGGA